MPAESPALAIVSASASLFVTLLVVVVDWLKREDYINSAAPLLQGDFGLSNTLAVAYPIILVLGAVLVLSVVFGTLIVLSSSSRSYIGHAWRGAIVATLPVALSFLVKAAG